MKKIKILGDENAPLFTVYNNYNCEVPVIANCPIANLNRAKGMFDAERFYIERHYTPFDLEWIIKTK